MPVWVPALPFALIALALFAFGLLAWFWGDEQPRSFARGSNELASRSR